MSAAGGIICNDPSMMRRGAGFQFQLRKEWQYLAPPQPAANDDRARRIDTMDLEDRFGEVDADCASVTHAMAPLIVVALTATTSWHFDAGWGAVHSIKRGPLSLEQTHT